MSRPPVLEIPVDDSQQKTSPDNNLTPTETENLETVAEAWKHVIRDVFSTRTDPNIQTNPEDKSGRTLDNVNIRTTLQICSNGGGPAIYGDSEVVPNNSNGGGGKTTSVLKPSPSVGISLENLLEVPIGGSGKNGAAENGSGMSMMDEAWEQLSRSYVYFKGQRVGTLAAIDTGGETLNYNQVAQHYAVTPCTHTLTLKHNCKVRSHIYLVMHK